MRTPRDFYGAELVKKLKAFGYVSQHQTGSHIIIRTQENGEHTLSIPNHKPLKIGTLDGILGEVANHFGLNKKDVLQRLFG